MKKLITERFQKLAGIKPLYEQPLPDEEVSGEELPDGEEGRVLDPSKLGTDGVLGKDSEKIQKIIQQLVNTPEEWQEVLQVLMVHGLTGGAGSLTDIQIKSILQNELKGFAKQ